MTLVEIYVKWSVILMDLLGPDIFTTLWMKGQVLHSERAHFKVPDWSLVWNKLLTKKLPMFLSRLNQISRGCEKIVPVLKWKNLKMQTGPPGKSIETFESESKLYHLTSRTAYMHLKSFVTLTQRNDKDASKPIARHFTLANHSEQRPYGSFRPFLTSRQLGKPRKARKKFIFQIGTLNPHSINERSSSH